MRLLLWTFTQRTTRFFSGQRPLVLLLFVIVAAAPVLSQRLSGTLRGQVTDSGGNIVVGAQVTATNEASGVKQATASNSAGTYVFPDILPGTYTVQISSGGFSESVTHDVRVVSNADTDRSVMLQVGGSNVTVEVNAAADTVDLTSSTLATTFSSKEAIDLPTGSSSPLQLAIFSANTTAQQGGVTGVGGSVAGNRPRFNSFNIDGVDDNDTGVTGSKSNVIQDAVAEFNLVVDQFSAEYGHAGSAQFNIITKSGGNQWHGSGELYVQNRYLNALDNLTKAALLPGGGLDHTPRFDADRFGGTVGGPLIKNRWFVFGAYEYYSQRAEGSARRLRSRLRPGLRHSNRWRHPPYIVKLLSALADRRSQ